MAAYVVGEIDVRDAAGYQAYALLSPAAVKKFGGRFIARGGATHTLEGAPPPKRVVIVEFSSVDEAKAFYNSKEYQAIIPLRQAASEGRLFVVEGLAAPIT
jgi:uncharacterized protein (DUF1330 family)